MELNYYSYAYVRCTCTRAKANARWGDSAKILESRLAPNCGSLAMNASKWLFSDIIVVGRSNIWRIGGCGGITERFCG